MVFDGRRRKSSLRHIIGLAIGENLFKRHAIESGAVLNKLGQVVIEGTGGVGHQPIECRRLELIGLSEVRSDLQGGLTFSTHGPHVPKPSSLAALAVAFTLLLRRSLCAYRGHNDSR